MLQSATFTQHFTLLRIMLARVELIQTQPHHTHNRPAERLVALRHPGVGVYNIVHWDVTILRAVSPHYWIMFLVREGSSGWRLLGSIVLCITGAPQPLQLCLSCLASALALPRGAR